MKLPWFKRFGILFLPRNVVGWIIFAAAVGYAVKEFIRIDEHSHSVSDTLINFAFNSLIVAAVYSVIAFFTSVKENE